MNTQDIKLDPNFQSGSGVSNYTSWRRLEEILLAAGEIKPDERVTGYKVDNNGIAFYIVTGKDNE